MTQQLGFGFDKMFEEQRDATEKEAVSNLNRAS
jgi:hypothetical protein